MPATGRFFNTAGPCRADIHYMVDPLRRLEGVRTLIDRQTYFVVHAPRQSGKTTSLDALARALTLEGRYTAILLSLERGRAYLADPGEAHRAILQGWTGIIPSLLPVELRPETPPTACAFLGDFFAAWSQASRRPLVIFLDEIDSLVGPVLISVLSQLREQHRVRPTGFPASIALIGMRDVRDYKLASGGGEHLGTSSPFNVTAASLALREFTREEVASLYAEHTRDTGQVFGEDALDLAFHLSEGQPWLVNALAAEVTDRLVPDRTRTLRARDVDDARERLILRQDTHLDSLAEKLRESRVRGVIEPMLAGDTAIRSMDDDRRYVVDLGLVRKTADGALRIANPIYHEIIPRVLASPAQESLPSIAPSWLRADNGLDPERLVRSFLEFWRQHGEALLGVAPYHEVAPQLVFLAFLHRVANGRGRVEREYAVGRGRMDVLLTYGEERVAFELKVWRPGQADPKDEGLEQLDGYLTSLGLDGGWLVIFDRRPAASAAHQRCAREAARTGSGRSVTVVRA